MKLAVVLPCYNEEEILEESAGKLRSVMQKLILSGKIDADSRICFVDDGSSDGTWDIIETLHRRYPEICGIKLSRNFGHQNALLAGLFSVDADAVITIDADLQDDISVIDTMIDKYREGFKVVYGVKKSRRADSRFKRVTAEAFYRFMIFMGVKIIYNHADFRLISKEVLEHLKDFNEVNLFLRGIIPLIGFPATTVEYDLKEREKGRSKFTLRKIIGFALNGITSFSVFPLRLITYIGFLIFVATLFMTGWAFWVKYCTDDAVPGWASTVLPIYFIGGIEVLALGIIGEYIGKIYMETKSRPRFIIEKKVE
ncbi:glycosyltransferase family 2 protein [Hydrogenimonas sp. SS33]|uniref:glycosyltransferase family 2 protein n=1 Tax=Hydrogenimonas leucolamina TaxID=2954236 RepID=UPI00336C0FC5